MTKHPKFEKLLQAFMKTAASLFTIALLAASSISSFAGSLGGPAPFRNGSPLPSGTDGTYQAVATATNVTGIISFAIQGGVQTSFGPRNRWVFFVDGQTLSGSTNVNVSEGKVAGVLDSGLGAGTDGSVPDRERFSQVIYVPGNAGVGSFTAKMDMNSPIASFKGSGLLQGTPNRTDQIVLISYGGTTVVGTSTIYFPPSVNILPITIPGSSLEDTSFRVRGSRVSQNSLSISDQLSSTTSN